jgi:hypothetical protein
VSRTRTAQQRKTVNADSLRVPRDGIKRNPRVETVIALSHRDSNSRAKCILAIQAFHEGTLSFTTAPIIAALDLTDRITFSTAAELE